MIIDIVVIHTTIVKNSSEHGPMHRGRWVMPFMRTGMITNSPHKIPHVGYLKLKV